MSIFKKCLPVLLVALWLAGCNTTFTSLTPQEQYRNPSGLYPVEVALESSRQTIRWDTIRPSIVVGTLSIPMTPTPLMTNRWEGKIPVPPDKDVVRYYFRFDFSCNAFGPAKSDSAVSPEYTLRIR
jgi:hypothetical protein